ncbi:MAG: hypothetical protein GY851_04470 [bacterium]|nr:hypothetical protein [bacterium]
MSEKAKRSECIDHAHRVVLGGLAAFSGPYTVRVITILDGAIVQGERYGPKIPALQNQRLVAFAHKSILYMTTEAQWDKHTDILLAETDPSEETAK